MFRAAVALSALGLVLASALCAQAQEQTEIRTWLGHKSCAVYRVSLPEGSARFQLVPSEAPTTYTYSLLGIATGCLSSEGGVCQQLADASPAACAVATDSVPTAGPLTGQLAGLQPGAEGFVYISNPHAHPVLVDVLVVIKPGAGASGRRHSRWSDALSLLRQLSAKAPKVVLEPASRPASSFRRSLQGASIASGSAAALGSRRRLQNHFHHGGNDDDDHGGFGGFFGGHHGGRGANCTNGTRGGAAAGAANSTGSANSTSGATTDVLNPNTGNSTATATTASNLIDQAANNYTGATRTWVKVAIIVAIVVVSLALLAMAACLVMCLCRRPRREAPAVPAGKQFIDA